MKHILLLSIVSLAVMLNTSCNSCQSNNGNNGENSDTTNVQADSTNSSSQLVDAIDFKSTERNLPQSINFNIDINSLSYAELRIYSYYPYALHGFWIKDFIANQFFSERSDWYWDLANNEYGYQSGKGTEDYWDKWWESEEVVMKEITLTPEEQAFYDRVKARMNELEKNKYIQSDGLNIANLSLIINDMQVTLMDNKMVSLLKKYNMAIEPTSYDQLFNIYEENDYHSMPSFITTDLYLQTFHMYFEYLLKLLEQKTFTESLTHFYSAMSTAASEIEANDNNSTDNAEILDMAQFVKTFSLVGLDLLTNKNSSQSVPENYKEKYLDEIKKAKAHTDIESSLLETKIFFNYSLFKPRGHYTRNETLQQYFRSMMWLQSAYFEFSDAKALKRAIALAKCYNNCNKATRDEFSKFNSALTYLMGEPDNASIFELASYISQKYNDKLLSELYLDEPMNDIKQWLEKKFAECNRIKPKIQESDVKKLNFLPQRYEPDSEVISNMFDETPNSECAYPRAIDVFDAFGSETAGALLDTFYNDSKKWAEFGVTRSTMKNTFNSYDKWNVSSYNKWLEMLVELQEDSKNMPSVMKTKAWKCKDLNTALASFAELKHDAILYAEQPLGAECGGGEGDLPSPILVGYVEPNVKFWQKMIECLDNLTSLFDILGISGSDVASKCDELTSKVNFCLSVAKKELNGQPLTEGEYGDIRIMGSSIEWFMLSIVDDEHYYDSWGLIQGPDKSIAVVADVFTRNIIGCEKSGILYEATGNPNAIYVIIEIDGSFYITRGATYSYYEFVRPLGDRLTDEQWQDMLKSKEEPSIPEWFQPFIIKGDKVEMNETFLYSSGC